MLESYNLTEKHFASVQGVSLESGSFPSYVAYRLHKNAFVSQPIWQVNLKDSYLGQADEEELIEFIDENISIFWKMPLFYVLFTKLQEIYSKEPLSLSLLCCDLFTANPVACCSFLRLCFLTIQVTCNPQFVLRQLNNSHLSISSVLSERNGFNMEGEAPFFTEASFILH